MRYFFSSGEPSGESIAVLLAGAIANLDPQARFEGIGAQAMRDAGFELWRDHTGWASMGPLAAIPRIPKLLVTMWRTALHLRAQPPDLLILVDFGAFNVRLATTLRAIGYRGPILDLFPPGTWLDDARKARAVSAATVPLAAFEHQHEFYRSLGCTSVYLGHPLAGRYQPRPPRPVPPADGGTVAMLPGSRAGELRRHLPLLLAAFAELRRRRPQLRGVLGVAGERAASAVRTALAAQPAPGIELVDGAARALETADAAWAASGTVVLEAALIGVPTVALYVINPILVKQGRKMIKHGFITLPNLVTGRRIVPELLQEEATTDRLVVEMERVLCEPEVQVREFAAMRRALGPPDALARWAQFAVDLARTGAYETPAA